ncbi:hypothetical protein Tco_0359333 [Tanacetum coccineum]
MPEDEGLDRCRSLPFSKELIWSSSSRSIRSALMVVEGEVLNDFPRFVDIHIVEFAAAAARETLLDVVGTSGCHFEVLQSFPVERIKQGNE